METQEAIETFCQNNINKVPNFTNSPNLSTHLWKLWWSSDWDLGHWPTGWEIEQDVFLQFAEPWCYSYLKAKVRQDIYEMVTEHLYGSDKWNSHHSGDFDNIVSEMKHALTDYVNKLIY